MPIEILKVSFDVDSFELGEGGLEVWELVDVAPVAGRGSAMELEDLENLVNLRITIKHRLFLDELGEDAADCPDIDAETVLLLAKQDFGRPVPESLDFVGEGLDGDSESACQPEVSYFEIAGPVDEQVLRLEVAMDDPAGVAVIDPVHQLVQEQLHLIGSDGVLVFR